MEDVAIFVIFFAGIWGFAGLMFLLIGLLMMHNINIKEKKCTEKTFAKVCDIVEDKMKTKEFGYTIIYYPVFEYNVGSIQIVNESTEGSSVCKYNVGQTVEIYYNPEDYNEYYTADRKTPKALAKFFIILGAILICVATAFTMVLL